MELDKVLDEVLDETLEELEENFDEEEIVECVVCETIVEMYWDPRYSGFRASCKECGFNWAES